MKSRGKVLGIVLLVLAVALGVGTAASGISLVAHTREYSRKTLASPACREIVVSTHDEADEMEAPVVEKPVRENAVLTSADLSAAEIVPAVTQAYVSNESRLRFFTAEEKARLGRGGAADGSGSAVSAEPAFPAAPPSEEPAADGAAEGPESAAGLMSDAVGQAAVGSAAAQTSEAAGRIGPGSPPGFRELTALIEASAADPDVIIPGVEEMRGYSVTRSSLTPGEYGPRPGASSPARTWRGTAPSSFLVRRQRNSSWGTPPRHSPGRHRSQRFHRSSAESSSPWTATGPSSESSSRLETRPMTSGSSNPGRIPLREGAAAFSGLRP